METGSAHRDARFGPPVQLDMCGEHNPSPQRLATSPCKGTGGAFRGCLSLCWHPGNRWMIEAKHRKNPGISRLCVCGGFQLWNLCRAVETSLTVAESGMRPEQLTHDHLVLTIAKEANLQFQICCQAGPIQTKKAGEKQRSRARTVAGSAALLLNHLLASGARLDPRQELESVCA